jgi:hypothetical protein
LGNSVQKVEEQKLMQELHLPSWEGKDMVTELEKICEEIMGARRKPQEALKLLYKVTHHTKQISIAQIKASEIDEYVTYVTENPKDYLINGIETLES